MVICAGAEDVDAWVGQVVHHGLVKLAVPALMPANETNMDACTIQARCGHFPCPSILALASSTQADCASLCRSAKAER